MKRLITIIGILALVGAVAVPVMAWGPGWGWGHHMMGSWGNDSGYGRNYYRNITSEQKSKLDTLDRKFNDEIRDLQDQIWTKSRELDIALNSSDPDFEKAKAFKKEISELRAKLDEKTLNYEIKVRKIVPDQRLGYAYGGGYDHYMGRYGHGTGYGPGNCWD